MLAVRSITGNTGARGSAGREREILRTDTSTTNNHKGRRAVTGIPRKCEIPRTFSTDTSTRAGRTELDRTADTHPLILQLPSRTGTQPTRVSHVSIGAGAGSIRIQLIGDRAVLALGGRVTHLTEGDPAADRAEVLELASAVLGGGQGVVG